MVKQALRLDHLYHLTGAHGLYQHATGADPNPEFGYCLDDNVRALMMALRAHALTGKAEVLDYAERYLAFVEQAQRPDGRFRNFMDAQGAWLEEVGSDDSNGRAVWGLGFAARYAPTAALRDRALRLLERSVPAIEAHAFPRAKGFSLIGLRNWVALGGGPTELARELADDLAKAFEASASEDWQWFEPELTYCNASLCDALLGTEHQTIGLASLDWLCGLMDQEGVLSLIGNDGWYVRGGRRAVFDQQAVDAAAVSSACVEAYRATGEPRYRRWARMAYGWFTGENLTGEVMIDPQTGGCYDGLRPVGHNPNQGAESLLAWLSAHEDMLELGWLDG
ncbi:MAG TPA: hypothetical protein VK009_03170 [Chloroflexota bacterium]|nr:hypothetical protein [Chloroflexota bacterium]